MKRHLHPLSHDEVDRVLASSARPFSVVGEAVRARLASAMEVRDYDTGELVIRQSDQGRFLLVLIDGSASAWCASAGQQGDGDCRPPRRKPVSPRPTVEASDLFGIIHERERFVLPPASRIGLGVSDEMHDFLASALQLRREQRTVDLRQLATWTGPVAVLR